MFGLDMWLVWFLAGCVIALAEMMIPGFIIVFFGLGCWGAAVVAAIAPEAWAWQIAAFLVVSVSTLVGLRRLAVNLLRGKTGQPRGVASSGIEIGTVIVVDVEMLPWRVGRVRYRGTNWDAKSTVAITAGSQAVIVGVDEINRSCLVIEPVSGKPESN